jgi:hypothetical protein
VETISHRQMFNVSPRWFACPHVTPVTCNIVSCLRYVSKWTWPPLLPPSYSLYTQGCQRANQQQLYILFQTRTETQTI